MSCYPHRALFVFSRGAFSGILIAIAFISKPYFSCSAFFTIKDHKQQCEAHLTDALSSVHHLPQTLEATDLYFTEFGLTSPHIFTVNCWLSIGDASKAYGHFVEMNVEDLADNRRASAYCDASKACTMMGEFERAQRLAFRAIDKASSTQQHYVIPRCIMVAQTIQQKAPDKPYAAAITEYAHLTLQQS